MNLRLLAVCMVVMATGFGPAGSRAVPRSPGTALQDPASLERVKQSLWVAETIRRAREQADYAMVAGFLVADAALRSTTAPVDHIVKAVVEKARGIEQDHAGAFPDPDLNAAALRAVLMDLRGSRVVDPALLDPIVTELDRYLDSGSARDAERAILPLDVHPNKLKLGEFLQTRLAALYEHIPDPRFDGLVEASSPVRLLDPRTTLSRMLSESGIAPGATRSLIETIASKGEISTGGLKDAAVATLQEATRDFGTARDVLQRVTKSLPPLDVSPSTMPNLAHHAERAAQLARAASGDLASFDFLHTASRLLPLPADVRETLSTAARVGSAVQSTVSTVSRVAGSLSTLGDIGKLGLSFLTTGGIGALAGALGDVFGGGGPSNQDVIDAVKEVGQQVQAMHRDMTDRFNRIDRTLVEINERLSAGFGRLNAALAVIDIKVEQLRHATNSIQATLLETRALVNRSASYTIGGWTEEAYRKLNRNLVSLLAAVTRAEAGKDDLARKDFREWAQDFTALAKTEVKHYPLTGLNPSETYSPENAVARLSGAGRIYPLNYLLSFPLSGQPDDTGLLAGVDGPIGKRRIAASPYANERVWALAANALAIMVERWPQFADEIPGLRGDYDAIISNGAEILDLVDALQASGLDSFRTPFSRLLRTYDEKWRALTEHFQLALRDQVTPFAAGNPRINQDAVRKSLTLGQSPLVQYAPDAIPVTGCGAEDVQRSLPGVFAVDLPIAAGLAFGKGRLSACVGIAGVTNERMVPARRGGFHMVRSDGSDFGPVCMADVNVKVVSISLYVFYVFHPDGERDQPASRYIVGMSHAAGPDTEVEATIVGNVGWSGHPTEAGHNWNLSCRRAYRPGYTKGLYIGNLAYFRDHWNAIAGSIRGASTWFGSNAYASGSGSAKLREVNRAVEGDVRRLHEMFLADLETVLDAKKSNGKASNLAGGRATDIENVLLAVEGVRALTRSLATTAFEQTLQRDDVLTGLLFGADGLPGRAELLEQLRDLRRQGIGAPAAAGRLKGLPDLRLNRLRERLAQVVARTRAGKLRDTHAVVDLTLQRLRRNRCRVPERFGGSADCAGSSQLPLPAGGAR